MEEEYTEIEVIKYELGCHGQGTYTFANGEKYVGESYLMR